MSADNFKKSISSYDKNSFESDDDRRQALNAARELCRRLETPMDTVLRTCWIEPATCAAAYVCKEVDMFNKLSEDGGSPKTTKQLAAATGVDEPLTSRLLRHLSTVEFVKETGSEEWAPNELSKALAEPRVVGGFNMLFDLYLPTAARLVEFLKTTGYKNPSGCPGPFQYAMDTPDPLFVWFSKNPQKLQGFQNHMQGYTSDRPGWLDIVDMGGIVDGFDNTKSDVLLVDIGGGYGQDAGRFAAKYPNVSGRLILQDQPHVVEKASQVEKVETMAYDFYTPQPVHGARAYYMHSILHDYNDERCIEILKNLMPAMTKGYSKLLINEMVIPPTNANPMQTSMDILLMACMGAGERKAKQFEELLGSVGYKVVKIHHNPSVPESVIEAELA